MDAFLDRLFDDDAIWEKAIAGGAEKHIKTKILENFTDPNYRSALKSRIRDGKKSIKPPHEAQVPKDDGTMRTVYVNAAEDRILFAAVNEALFRYCPDMVHQSCMSYRSGIGCGKVAREVAKYIKTNCQGLERIGWKIDLSKYFDTVDRKYIEQVFESVASRLGPSALLTLLNVYYHDDRLQALDGHMFEKYTSLRQGCAVASFLADSVLYPVDSVMSKMDVGFWRYSDDILILGPHANAAFETCSEMLKEMGLSMNQKKIERLTCDKWFTFLGFSIKGGEISLSKKRLGNFQKAVRDRTVDAAHPVGSEKAMSRVASWLYEKGESGYGYAEGILPVLTSIQDLRQMDAYILDCLRACDTGRTKLGGLGYNKSGNGGVIERGRGRNVSENRKKRPRIDGYTPLTYMRSLYRNAPAAYAAYANLMLAGSRALSTDAM